MRKHNHGCRDGSMEKRKRKGSGAVSLETETDIGQRADCTDVDDYDGYYDDRIPCDAGELARPRDYGVAKQLVLVGICFLLIVAASIAVMYLL